MLPTGQSALGRAVGVIVRVEFDETPPVPGSFDFIAAGADFE